MGVLDMLENLKENKWNGGMKTMNNNTMTRQIVQTNLNVVLMNKEIVDMSKELMKINWANGFNLKEETKFTSNSRVEMKLMNNEKFSNESYEYSDVKFEVDQMNREILQMNNTILDMNQTYSTNKNHNLNNAHTVRKVPIRKEFDASENFDESEKENREPKTENRLRKQFLNQDFQKETIQESREQLNHRESRLINKCKQTAEKTKETKETELEVKREANKRDIKKDVEIILRNKNSANKTLIDIVKDREEGDMFIVNTDNELTDTIKNTFEHHGCKVTVSQLEKDLIALYVLLNRKISIKKLRRLIEKGNKFGLEFFLTKTGMTTSLLSKVHQIFKW